MATYSSVATSELAVNKPLTSSLMTRLNDNPIAIFEQLGWGVNAGRSISGEYTPTVSGLITFTHGLTVSNVYEIDVSVYLICKTAEHNYSVNDVVLLNPAGDENDLNSSYSMTLTTTQILLRMGNAAINVRNKTTGTIATITVANWRIVLKARA